MDASVVVVQGAKPKSRGSYSPADRMMRSPAPLLLARQVAAVACFLGAGHFAFGQSDVSDPPQVVSTPGSESKFGKDLDNVLWWLPEDTESVVVSRGNPPIPEVVHASSSAAPSGAPTLNPPLDSYVDPTDDADYQDLVATQCIEPLADSRPLFTDQERKKLIHSLYGPKTATLFVKAMRWEKNQVREWCDLVVFRDNSADRIVRALSVFPGVSASIDGVQVIEIDMNYVSPAQRRSQDASARQESAKPTWPDRRWLAAPRPNVYLAATNMEMLRVILDRMRQRGLTRALPNELPEWRQFDPSVPAWGLRHYRTASASKDHLSMAVRDPNAVGLVFFGTNKPSTVITLRYVSSSHDADVMFRRMQEASLDRYITDCSSLPDFVRVGTDCVQSQTRIYAPWEATQRRPLSNLDKWDSYICMDMMFLRWLGFPSPWLVSMGGYEEPDPK